MSDTTASPSMAPAVPTKRYKPTVQLPAPDCDVLRGLPQIALWLGITVNQCREDIRKGLVPVHKAGQGQSTIYAFKSEILSQYRAALKAA